MDALSLDEALLLARDLPRLASLIDGNVPGIERRGALKLARGILNVAQGHPKLLELADSQAATRTGFGHWSGTEMQPGRRSAGRRRAFSPLASLRPLAKTTFMCWRIGPYRLSTVWRPGCVTCSSSCAVWKRTIGFVPWWRKLWGRAAPIR